MSQQQYTSHPINKKTSFIVFVKGSVAPIVLYLDEPIKVYQNIQNLLRSPQPPKFFEIEASGPIKKVTLVTSEVSGCALQEEIVIGK